MSIAGCAAGPSRLPAPVCPQLIEYSPADQAKAADELKRLPVSGVVRSKFLPDYGTMRDEVRACRKT